MTEAWFPNRAIGILQQMLRKSQTEHERLFLVFISSCLFVYFDFFLQPDWPNQIYILSFSRYNGRVVYPPGVYDVMCIRLH